MTDLLAALKADPAMPKALEMDEFLSQDVNCDVVTLEVANSYADACMIYAYRKGLEDASKVCDRYANEPKSLCYGAEDCAASIRALGDAK